MKWVGLSRREDNKISTYSLGMRQRLGLAQALIAQPKLLILDEPTNGLDPSGMRELRELLHKIASTGVAVFISSHLLHEIELLCDRVAIINQGTLIAETEIHKLTNAAPIVTLEVSQLDKAKNLLSPLPGIEVSLSEQHILLKPSEKR
ncbi:ATP-binding cassette domain-containing protein [Pullulanibacillus pueri]|uniref:ATP-binding cassette domain-containing protein n=1 Tax=Pullulanibacillus pueri TaxID=1437324 RepID=UPI00227B8F20